MRYFPNTIRSQIVMAFSICFLFMAVMIITNYVNLLRLSNAMHFFEIAEELNSTILEMRRYEKNFFLFQQAFNYEENLTYTNRLSLLLARERDNLTLSIGKDNLDRFSQYTQEYADLMYKLKNSSCGEKDCIELKDRIRELGQNLLLFADQLVTTERRTIDRRLQRLVPFTLFSLVILVILLSIVVFFIGEKVVRPLARITRESQAIAMGAFTRLTPFGARGNEINQLIDTLNSMVGELESRHRQLVQASKVAAIGTLTSGIAHELNNPINNISLIIESLMEDEDELSKDERYQLYQDAIDQSERASDTVKNLLEFSRASHSRMETMSVKEVVEKTTRLIKNEIQMHRINFTLNSVDDIPVMNLDKNGLQQVFLNLFLNSIHAMPNGGELKVDISLPDKLNEVRVTVADTGVGIPAENLDRVFDPFFTTKREGEGTGLGLPVSFNIIRNHGGNMEVSSKPGEGTCFTIHLPLNQGDESRWYGTS